MNKKAKLLITIAVFVIVLAGGVYSYNTLSQRIKPAQMPLTPPQNSEVQSGNSAEGSSSTIEAQSVSAPDFTVYDVAGNQVDFKDFLGKPVVINFWASWCTFCVEEMPAFEKLYNEMGDDVTFLMIDLVGDGETREKGQAFIKENGFNFPVYFDDEQSAAMTYGITSLPTSIFINSEGNIVTGAQGAISEEQLRYGISLINGGDSSLEQTTDRAEKALPEYKTITPEEAKSIIDAQSGAIILDVRTLDEYNQGHIKDALLITDTEIKALAEEKIPDKDAVILVYCRTGRRSEGAAKELVKLGYTNVYDFGGIVSWHYDTVK